MTEKEKYNEEEQLAHILLEDSASLSAEELTYYINRLVALETVEVEEDLCLVN